MPTDALPILVIAFLVVGALYASVGHAGASVTGSLSSVHPL